MGHLALNLSLQNRLNFLCGTHLPTQMRKVIHIFEEALCKRKQQAYGMNLRCTAPAWPGQQDPEFTRDQANLRTSDGGVGIRDTSEQAFYLNTMCNIAPAIAGDANQPSLWPTLRERAFGQNLLQHDTEEGGWAFFYRAGCPFATEIRSEIERVKGLYSQASQDAGQEQDPGKAIFEVPISELYLRGEFPGENSRSPP